MRSLTEGLNSGTCAGQIVIGVLALAAEYEVALRAERAEAKCALLCRSGGNPAGQPPRFDAERPRPSGGRTPTARAWRAWH